MTKVRRPLAFAVLSLLALPQVTASKESPGAAASAVPTYRAVYRVEQKGRTAGTAEVAVSYDEQKNTYLFESTIEMTGVYKLLIPRPVVARSEFTFENDHFVPMRASSSDGRNTAAHVEFDWQRQVAVTDSGAEIPVETGTLDQGTLRVWLMHTLSNAGHLGPQISLDNGELKSYDFVRVVEAVLDPLATSGRTEVFVQQRPGSSRKLVLSLDPQRCFLPIRMEQESDGENQLTFVMESVEGIDQDTCTTSLIADTTTRRSVG